MGDRKGDYITGRTAQKVRRVGHVKGVVGAMHGNIQNFDNGGKDRAIQGLEKSTESIFSLLLKELKSYHEQEERKDNYLREVVRKSFERNEKKDIMIMRLIEMVISQDARIQDRADRLFNLVERNSTRQIE